ncbi:phospholipase C, phosphocholine-specific [Sphingomonas sp. RHCKR7]|uniref:phosphocholine-specific phospholipase C n=1 Tax=Sphingomonas folli TaxID=2862497 RepID=UPI001CA47E6C|nr:phospholipase C, phosphocholine-specific [Sphingomonas folli]MBW6526468.1 phospholipase C, phosphocholine-specific [Sphingomonas folli]
MNRTTRRGFIGGAAGATALLPGLLDRALAIAPSGRTGTIRDVEHVVIHMQENRSFDHYLGMLNGVRGFGDPRPARLPGGRTIWAQPSQQHADGYVLPYHGDSTTTRSFKVDGGDQSHPHHMHILHQGRCDRWGASEELHHRMLHYGPGDLPFYYALADAFTVCDAYHASTLTQTYPNRLHLFSGCNGGGAVGGEPEMSNYGEDETPSADMRTDKPLREEAYRWTTYAERLQAAGVTWNVYQEYDNFGDNLLSVFPAFRPCARDTPLYRRGRGWVSEHATGADRTRSDGEQLVAAFRADVAAGRLPQVSWIVTAADLSEHPSAEPAKGEHVTARLIEALVDHPAVFAKTAFLLIYDEPGGFYDHVPPPVPPIGACRGHSTVSLDGEAKTYPADAQPSPGTHPIGLGIRTPTIIVSPWTRGGHVCSELFDHTSVLRFLEARFGVREPNISTWRRAVCGDLTSAFDFRDGGSSDVPPLPRVDDFRERVARSAAGTACAIPAVQRPTVQLPGQRGARALPYAIDIVGLVTEAGRLRLEMINRGRQGAVLCARDNRDREAPWHFTIGAGERHAHDRWSDDAAYDLTLSGPDGLYQRYAGDPAARADVLLTRSVAAGAAALTLVNRATFPRVFVVTLDAAYPGAERERRHRIAAGSSLDDVWALQASDLWYDLLVRIEGDATFVRRFAGRVDSGAPGRTDPAIGAMRLTV